MTNEELLQVIHAICPRLRLRNPATLPEVATMNSIRAELVARFGLFDFTTGEQERTICLKGFDIDCGLAPGHDGECVSRRRLERGA